MVDVATLRQERDRAEAEYRAARNAFVGSDGPGDDERRDRMEQARRVFDEAVAAVTRAELQLPKGDAK